MLSRVADHLYWTSRYLERAEHTARLLDVNLHGVLDQSSGTEERHWKRVQSALRTVLPADSTGDARAIVRALSLDPAYPTSIISCITAARDNARQAWEQLSSEMWEEINRLFLFATQNPIDEQWAAEPHAFFSAVKAAVHLFTGVTDMTMSHSEGWHFIQLGRGIERSANTARLLNVYFADDDGNGEPLEFLEWVGLLKSCTAFEAYVKIHSPTVDPANIAAFLLLNAEFPRSVRFSAAQARLALQAIGRSTGSRGASRPERMAGRLLSSLEYAHIEEVFAEGIHDYLDSIEAQCSQIHSAVHHTFIRYPVAGALAAQAP